MTIYIDTDATHDHTYYGNGCYEGTGSSTPCSSHLIETIDNEEQEIGTYYHFQAITSGSGGGTTADDANAPDSFCPLGWQLPYSGRGGDYYDKSKSWRYLYSQYNLVIDRGDTPSANKLSSYPLSYIRSGYINFYTMLLSNMGYGGIFWSSSVSGGSAYRMGLFLSAIEVSASNGKTHGFAIRCAHRFSILS